MDPQLRDFYGRIDRIEKIHEAGGGFEAAGTLGLSHYTRQRRSRRHRNWLFPLVLVMASIVAVKAVVLARIGAEAYAQRVAVLAAGDTADRVGAYVLQADPLTVQVAALLTAYTR
ncbi:MAG: hypothetical protein ACOY5U_08380 [Pseudomonadota bacterium]